MTRTKDTLRRKWGEEALLMGWTAVPTTLLFLQGKLSITPLGLNVLLNLISHWWEYGESPYPSQEALATRMGVSKRSIQREVSRLCRLGLLHKESSSVRHPQYKGRNTYDLSPLVEILCRESPGLVKAMQTRRAQFSQSRSDLQEK